MEWAKIRGPIGGPRQDWYHSNLAICAGRPWPEDSKISEDDFLPYWAKKSAEEAKKITAEAAARQEE